MTGFVLQGHIYYFHVGPGVTSHTKTHSSLVKAPNNYVCFILLCEIFQMAYDTLLSELYDVSNIL